MKRNRLKALIVDDEKDARDLLHYYLKNNTGISEIAEAATVEDALYKFMEFSPDIVFLDIVMPGKDGIDFIELLKKRQMDSNIIITTAHKDSAIDAIKNHIYDFILKPLDIKEINRVIEKYRKRKDTSLDKKMLKVLSSIDQSIKIKISTANGYTLIDPNDILYFEADGPYTFLHLENGSREMTMGYLSDFIKILENQRFFRISRSYLINTDKLSYIDRTENCCALIGNKKEIKLYGSKAQIRILCDMDLDSLS